jgi:hypothetical protein
MSPKPAIDRYGKFRPPAPVAARQHLNAHPPDKAATADEEERYGWPPSCATSLSDEQFRDTVTGAGGTIFTDEGAYVGRLAGRLLRADEQALLERATRVRAVRNPNLRGDVSPQAAANALRDALPGVSDDVVTATAEALAESEATRTAFQRDRDASVALERFAEARAGHVVDVVTAAHTGVTETMKARGRQEVGAASRGWSFEVRFRPGLYRARNSSRRP